MHIHLLQTQSQTNTMADQLADSLSTVRSSGDDIIIGDSLQTHQYTVTFDLRTSIIIGFSLSLFFCIVYHILCSFFYRLIDTRIYYHRGDVSVEEGRGLNLVPGGEGGGDTSRSQQQGEMFRALVLSNMQAWVMRGASMEDSHNQNVDESRGETLRVMKKLPALVKYGYGGSEDDDDDEGDENKVVRRNCGDCVICLEDLKVGDMCQIFPTCNHVFHSNCIDSWLATNLTCPTCRSYIT